MPNPAWLPWAHRVTQAGLILLILCGFLPSLLERFSTPRWTFDLLFSLPLLLFAVLLRPERPKRYAWLCFVILIYFCQGVMEAFTWPKVLSYYGLATVALSCEIFVASMLATRWAGQTLARATTAHA